MAAASARHPDAPRSQSGKLEDHAATAALYVTKGHRATTSQNNHPVLDADGKLSSAGAAMSLKYAKSSELPSYPTSGLKLSSAGAAASLASANHKNLELWQADTIPAAEKAAVLAKDYQPDPSWHPELSSAGSRAALLAARDGAQVDIWQPGETDHGYSAAGQAMRTTGLSPNVQRGVPADASRRAILAATGALSGSRRRAESAPVPPEPRVDSPFALSAARGSQRAPPSTSTGHESPDPALDWSRIQNVARSNVSRQMYTSNPPVAIEVEEKNRQDTLRASAVAMAKKMYAMQQSAIEAAARNREQSDSQYAATHVHRRSPSITSDTTTDETHVFPQYTNLQEAAQKLATERLAKLHDEHAEYRSYYGQSMPNRSRLSRRLRRRASSDGQLSELDEEQSQKIRSQMSLFQSKLAEVDEKKKQKDREALMAAAQRNVTARMQTMDDQVFEETGKVSPAMMQEWEAKARERAQLESDNRMEHHGKVHIGKGKFLEQADVDAVARTRLQPTFDEITEKAEQQRARDQEVQLELEEQKRKADLEKQRQADLKAEQKRVAEEEKRDAKAKRAGEQQEGKAKRAEEKAKLAEEKRTQKEEKRRSQGNKGKGLLGGVFGLGLGATGATAATAAAGGEAVATEAPSIEPIPKTEPLSPKDIEESDTEATASDEHNDDTVAAEKDAPTPAREDSGGLLDHLHSTSAASAAAKPVDTIPIAPDTPVTEEHVTAPTSPASPASPPKGESKVKSWWKTRFRRSSKPAPPSEGTVSAAAEGDKNVPDVGEDGTPSEERPREDSVREVAMVGRTSTNETGDDGGLYSASEPEVSPPVEADFERRGRSSPSISSLSSEEQPAESKPKRWSRLGLKGKLLGKPSTKESTEDDKEDEFEEARDTFEEDKLAPPPKLSTMLHGEASGRPSGSPIRDSKFSEDL